MPKCWRHPEEDLQEPHACPYQEEMRTSFWNPQEDEYESVDCECCALCEGQCAMDI